MFYETLKLAAQAILRNPMRSFLTILGIVIGYAVFEEIPTVEMLAGGAIVVGAGIFIIWREQQLGLKRGAARRVAPPQ